MQTQSEQPPLAEPDGERASLGGNSASFSRMLSDVANDKNRAAFSTLFAHYAPKVKSLAVRMGADTHAAEEIVQDTFLSVWRAAKTYDPKQAAASTWIYTVARNAVIDRLRRQGRPEIGPSDLMFEAEEEPHADARIDNERRASYLRTALAGLPGEQAEVLRTYYFEGKSHGRIAEELDLPLGTVKSRIRLALDRLRSALRDAQ